MPDNTPVDAECGPGSEEDRKQTAVSFMISPPEVEQKQDGGASEKLGLAKSAIDNAVIHTSAVSANATGTSSSSSSATEKDFLSEPALVSLVEQAPSPGGQRGTPIPAYGLGCSVYTPIVDPHDDWSAITNRVGFFIRNSVIELPPPLYDRSIVIPCSVTAAESGQPVLLHVQQFVRVRIARCHDARGM